MFFTRFFEFCLFCTIQKVKQKYIYLLGVQNVFQIFPSFLNKYGEPHFYAQLSIP